MTRRARAIVALGALLALGAIGAQAAQASPELTGFETDAEANRIHVHSIYKATTEAGAVETLGTSNGMRTCHVTYEGTSLTGKATNFTASVAYLRPSDTTTPGCEAVASTPSSGTLADVNMNSCDYVFQLETKLKQGEYTGSAGLHCDVPGDMVHVKVTKNEAIKCTMTYPEQTGLKHVIFKNNASKEGEPADVTIEITLEGTKYISEGGLLNCGVANGEHTSGVSSGKETLKAFNTEGKQIDVEVSGE